MSNQHEGPPTSPPEGRPKRPYESPRIVSESILETTALGCGKLSMQGGACSGGRASAS